MFSRKQQLVAGASTNTISISPREHSFEIDSSKFLLSTNTEISSLVIKELGLPVTKTMKMEAYLDKLILHEVDGQYTHTADLDKEFGKIYLSVIINCLYLLYVHCVRNIRYSDSSFTCSWRP